MRCLKWVLQNLVLAGSFGALPVGGCGVLAVSRKTPIYFILQLTFDGRFEKMFFLITPSRVNSYKGVAPHSGCQIGSGRVHKVVSNHIW